MEESSGQFTAKLLQSINQMDPAWRSSFIDHEKLRKQVKKIVFVHNEHLNAVNQANQSINNPNITSEEKAQQQSINQTIISQHQARTNKYHSQFHSMLAQECHQMEGFFNARAAACSKLFDELGLDQPNNLHQAVHPIATLAFAKVLMETFPQHSIYLLHSDLSMRAMQSSINQLEPRQIALFKRFLHLCYEIDQLRKYVLINHFILWKLIKKYDKHTGQDSVRGFLLMLKTYSFHGSTTSKLIVRAQFICNRLLCVNQPNHPSPDLRQFNLRKSGACPVCAREPMFDPLSLACTHAMCFECMLHQPSFGSTCPCCSKDQVWDAHLLGIESVLSDRIAQVISVDIDNSHAAMRPVNGLHNSVTTPTSSVNSTQPLNHSLSKELSPAHAVANALSMNGIGNALGSLNPAMQQVVLNAITNAAIAAVKAVGATNQPHNQANALEIIQQAVNSAIEKQLGKFTLPTHSNQPNNQLMHPSHSPTSTSGICHPMNPSMNHMIHPSLQQFNHPMHTNHPSAVAPLMHPCAPMHPFTFTQQSINQPMTSSNGSVASPKSYASGEESLSQAILKQSNHLKPRSLHPCKMQNSPSMSCHQCKTVKDSHELHACTNHRDTSNKKGKPRKCKKKFCEACLRRSYGQPTVDAAKAEGVSWACPSCQKLCICASCQRGPDAQSSDDDTIGAATEASGSVTSADGLAFLATQQRMKSEGSDPARLAALQQMYGAQQAQLKMLQGRHMTHPMGQPTGASPLPRSGGSVNHSGASTPTASNMARKRKEISDASTQSAITLAEQSKLRTSMSSPTLAALQHTPPTTNTTKRDENVPSPGEPPGLEVMSPPSSICSKGSEAVDSDQSNKQSQTMPRPENYRDTDLANERAGKQPKRWKDDSPAHRMSLQHPAAQQTHLQAIQAVQPLSAPHSQTIQNSSSNNQTGQPQHFTFPQSKSFPNNSAVVPLGLMRTQMPTSPLSPLSPMSSSSHSPGMYESRSQSYSAPVSHNVSVAPTPSSASGSPALLQQLDRLRVDSAGSSAAPTPRLTPLPPFETFTSPVQSSRTQSSSKRKTMPPPTQTPDSYRFNFTHFSQMPLLPRQTSQSPLLPQPHPFPPLGSMDNVLPIAGMASRETSRAHSFNDGFGEQLSFDGEGHNQFPFYEPSPLYESQGPLGRQQSFDDPLDLASNNASMNRSFFNGSPTLTSAEGPSDKPFDGLFEDGTSFLTNNDSTLS